ncbi:LINE-1 type transposase domain-containing 1 [Labeo rohita]|uniref:LINE-1 type transposase domain-containing 1 n=1 Tax=Labeo rohita TaxID=84645 RepID=A0A498NUP7_LABRO|nr:LINE-1 type transposase domain-containing 1 [Labeo rohita]
MQSKKKIKNKGRLEAESQITPSELESLSEHEETEDEGGEASNENPSNAEMMKAFKAMERQVSGKVDEILSAVVDVKVRLTEAEERISGTEDEIVQLKARNDTLEKQVKSMADKVIDLENRSRRNNLRLVGLPEKEEGSDTCAFLEKFLPETLELGESVTPLIIERAHRIPSSGQKIGQDGKVQPRTVIMKFLNFKQKEHVLKAAKSKGAIAYKGSSLRFFPDLSAELHRQQRKYDAIRQKLRDKGINRHRIIFPARLLLHMETVL